jgi:RNA polymerase sigma-70 factor (ECF subfamily)
MLATTIEALPAGDVLNRAQTGDHAAFAEIVREHQSLVFSIACHYVRDRDTAEELAQEVFLHLYRNLGTIESAPHLLNWLRRVTVQRSIDQTRRAKYRPKSGLESAPEPAAIPEQSDPLMSTMLRKLVGALPERARAVVILRYQEDLEPSEIADILELPVGTVKSSLHRALGLLRGKLERAGKGVRHESV